MAAVIKFTATKLEKSGKQGILKPDENGYYTMVIGGLNAFNSVGEYYTLDGARDLFEKSSILMRRVANGCLKGEVGHPKKQVGMTFNDYVNRVMTIEETNVCCIFAEIWLDPEFGRTHPEFKNQNLVAIMAKVKPSGPHGEMLRRALESPGENVCFSIRALTKDYFERGQNYRVLSTVVGFDMVVESGISCATKFSSPAMESINDFIITKKSLIDIRDNQSNGIAVESTKEMVIECLKTFDSSVKNNVMPKYIHW